MPYGVAAAYFCMEFWAHSAQSKGYFGTHYCEQIRGDWSTVSKYRGFGVYLDEQNRESARNCLQQVGLVAAQHILKPLFRL